MTSTSPNRFSSLLVANRGEIACRVLRSAKAMGLRTIAVYSDADADAPHVQMADAAYRLGPAPVGESYLDRDRIMAAIAATGAEAVHPGYGFLSENADFAQACADARVVFVGPPIAAIDVMGDKAKSKRRMIAAGVPCVPGYQGEDQDDATLIAAAQEIGFPIMVKAAAGGGGRGMRLVAEQSALPEALIAARSEARNAFGSDELILERAIVAPRHVEIQVFADQHGHVIHLGERDCSVQRRHQKVLEEAPCPVMTAELRAEMGAAAVKAAQDVDYIGAGTVEFLLDASGAFYFLEMNTRLQVEHPVTEMVTGLDLVAMQIRVAQGDALDLTQGAVTLSGHAIEARLYAEDPAQDFLPATGPIHLWVPASGDGVRVDSGIASGGAVSPFYDPMIAKLIAHGANRDEARRKLITALKDTRLFGVTTNRRFLIDALEREAFASGAATTAFIGDHFSDADRERPALTTTEAAVAAVLLFVTARQKMHRSAVAVVPDLLNWASATPITTPYRFADGDENRDVAVTPLDADHYTVTAANGDGDLQALTIRLLALRDDGAQLVVDGARQNVAFHRPASDSAGARIQLSVDGRDHDLTNAHAVLASATEAAGAGAVTAPMHGLLLELFVAEGQTVAKGDRLAIVEAMKMQHELVAEVDGTVTAIHFAAGTQVAANALLLDIAMADGG